MAKSPEKPGDLNMQNLKYLRFVDPEDSTKIIQIALTDTGTLTSDGTRIYALGIAAGGAGMNVILTSPLPLPTEQVRPGQGTGGSLTMGGSPVPLPVTTDAMYVWLHADQLNNGPITINGGPYLYPGESMIIETDVDASWITASGINPDSIRYLILRRL